jgi:uncharacterized membrane protein
MKKTFLALLAALALTLGLTASASGSANTDHAACLAGATSSYEDNLGALFSSLAQDLHPLGPNLPAYEPGVKCPEG